MAEFHPGMLGRQGPPSSVIRRDPAAGFHPDMLAGQPLGALPPPATGFDVAAGTITVGGNTIKLVPAILSALAVKLVFFGGDQAAKGAKRLAGKLRGSSTKASELATNPRKSERPWQAVRFSGSARQTKRHKTKDAAQRWCDEHSGQSRVSYVG